MNILKVSKNKPLVDAIANRHPISFMYYGDKNRDVLVGKRQYAEPVAIGISKKGNLMIRCYIEPPTKSKSGYKRSYWRTYLVSGMRGVVVMKSKTFDLTRPLYNGGGDDRTMVTTLFSNEPGADPYRTPKQIQADEKNKQREKDTQISDKIKKSIQDKVKKARGNLSARDKAFIKQQQEKLKRKR